LSARKPEWKAGDGMSWFRNPDFKRDPAPEVLKEPKPETLHAAVPELLWEQAQETLPTAVPEVLQEPQQESASRDAAAQLQALHAVLSAAETSKVGQPSPEKNQAPTTPAPAAPTAGTGLPPLSAVPQKARDMINAHEKLQAITFLRKHFGLSLKAAKDLADAVVEEEIRKKVAAVSRAALEEAKKKEAQKHAAPAVSGQGLAEVKQLLAAGRKLEAVKVLRQRYGIGLSEAKELADALEHQR